MALHYANMYTEGEKRDKRNQSSEAKRREASGTTKPAVRENKGLGKRERLAELLE